MTLRTAALATMLLVAGRALGDQVFLREADVPRALFGDGVTDERKSIELSDAELAELSKAVGRRVDIRSYPYLEVWKQADGSRRLLGHAFVLDVIGQSLPITFAVGVRPDGAVQDVEVMVYREPHGGEIRERRFRAQFAGKRLEQPLTVGKDIDAITGATISSHSTAYAVRKALALAAIVRRRAEAKPR